MTLKTMTQWQQEINANNAAHGFLDEPKTPGDSCALIHSEISEAYEEFRAGHTQQEIYFVLDKYGVLKPEGYPVELADALIRILGHFEEIGEDAEEVMSLKHEYNLTRPFRHGKVI